MTIKIANNALANCTSIEQVVELINNEFETDASPELIAAAYALNAAEFSDYVSDREVVECHLDYLQNAGAKFGWSKAFDIAHIVIEEANKEAL